MALTPGTETYITLADAELYLSMFSDEGAIVTESDLRKATLAIDRLYGGRFIGTRAVVDQPLQFPRLGSTDIPIQLEHATAELAVMLNGGLNVYAQPAPLVTEESIEVDVIKTRKKYTPNGYSTNFLHSISVILAPLLVSTSGISSMAVTRG